MVVRWVGFLLLLFFTTSFLLRTDRSFEQDLGRHFKLGEIIWAEKSVPQTNLFSYTNPDFPFINHHFLFEVWAYLVKSGVGLEWLVVLKVLIMLVAVGLTIKLSLEKNPLLTLPVGFLFLHVLRERAELRPEILSFLFTSLTYLILERFRDGRSRPRSYWSKWVWFLPLIQLLWINTHIYFPIGVLIQGIFLVDFLISKQFTQAKLILFVTILSILIMFVSPWGVKSLLYPLQVFQNYGYTIAENQNMFLLESINFKNPNFLFVKIAAGLVILSVLVGWIRRTLQLRYLLLSLLGLTLALAHVRSFPYLVFVSLPATLANFGVVSGKRWVMGLIGLTGLLLLIESFFYLNGDYYRYNDSGYKTELVLEEKGQRALDFVLTQKLPGPIYNNFDIGGYLIYRLFPQYQMFIDNRPEAYPASFFQQVYIPGQSNYEEFKKQEEKYGFQTIIFSHTDQTPWGTSFLKSVVGDESFRVIYIDDFIMVLVRKEVVLEKNLLVVDLSGLSPLKYQFDNHVDYLKVALALLKMGYQERAKLFTQQALSLFPDSPLGNLLMANFDPFKREYYSQKSQNNFWW